MLAIFQATIPLRSYSLSPTVIAYSRSTPANAWILNTAAQYILKLSAYASCLIRPKHYNQRRQKIKLRVPQPTERYIEIDYQINCFYNCESWSHFHNTNSYRHFPSHFVLVIGHIFYLELCFPSSLNFRYSRLLKDSLQKYFSTFKFRNNFISDDLLFRLLIVHIGCVVKNK